jgi:hypothetical protein
VLWWRASEFPLLATSLVLVLLFVFPAVQLGMRAEAPVSLIGP